MAWVEEERRCLASDFRAADPSAPTLCAGWTARHLCAHLVQRQDMMLRNIWDQATTRVPGEERFMNRLVNDATTPEGYAALVDRFEEGPLRRSLVGRFDQAFNLVEYIVHHEDLRRGSGPLPARELPENELDEIWRRAQPILNRAYRKSPVGVALSPGGKTAVLVRKGPSTVTVSGPILEVVLHAFGRRAAAEVRVDGSRGDVDVFTRWATRT